jgi:hypothetical protein
MTFDCVMNPSADGNFNQIVDRFQDVVVVVHSPLPYTTAPFVTICTMSVVIVVSTPLSRSIILRGRILMMLLPVVLMCVPHVACFAHCVGACGYDEESDTVFKEGVRYYRRSFHSFLSIHKNSRNRIS